MAAMRAINFHPCFAVVFFGELEKVILGKKTIIPMNRLTA